MAEEMKLRLLREAAKLVGIVPERKILPLADLLDKFARPEK